MSDVPTDEEVVDQEALDKAAREARLANPGPVATDDAPGVLIHPMELPANPAARAAFPQKMVDTSANPQWSDSIGADAAVANDRLVSAVKARAQFDQPEPEEWEKPHLEKGQQLIAEMEKREAEAVAAATADPALAAAYQEDVAKLEEIHQDALTEVSEAYGVTASDTEAGGGT